jgi:hypothetical protein
MHNIGHTPRTASALFSGKRLFSDKFTKSTRHLQPIQQEVLPQAREWHAMSRIPLRIYNGPQDDSAGMNVAEAKDARQTVTVSLSEVLPLLAEAVKSDRTWLHDFENDEVTISMDLYEVILAYQFYRRPSA